MEVRSVEAIVKALNDAHVQYLIVGGLGVIAHGYQRAPIITLETLLAMKREAGRPQDLADMRRLMRCENSGRLRAND